jgi:calcium-dependent protein kinase
LKLVRKGKFEFEPQHIWKDVSENAHDLIRRILCVEVDARFGADQAFHHAWCCTQKSETGITISGALVAQIHRFLTNNRLKRVALRMIAREIDDDVIAQQRSVWLSIDDDNSGSLTLNEMHEAVRRLDVNDMIRDGMVEIVAQLDPTGSGVVEWTEFLAASLDKKQYLKEEICRAAFVRLDFDGDGLLSRKDLGRLLSDKDGMRDAGLTGATLGEMVDELEQIMITSDVNNDGGVSFEEFMQLMADDGALPAITAARKRSIRENDYGDDLRRFWKEQNERVESEKEQPDESDLEEAD